MFQDGSNRLPIKYRRPLKDATADDLHFQTSPAKSTVNSPPWQKTEWSTGPALFSWHKLSLSFKVSYVTQAITLSTEAKSYLPTWNQPPQNPSRQRHVENALNQKHWTAQAVVEDRHHTERTTGKLNSNASTMWSYSFASNRFHVLLNSLFKVLFNFPSRYLYAIGLRLVFSLKWSLPPTLGCIPKQPDSKDNSKHIA